MHKIHTLLSNAKQKYFKILTQTRYSKLYCILIPIYILSLIFQENFIIYNNFTTRCCQIARYSILAFLLFHIIITNYTLKKYKHLLSFALLFSICLIGSLYSSDRTPAQLLILIYASINVCFRQIAKYTLFSITPIITIIIVFSLIGIIPEHTVLRDSTIRHSLGFIYPSFASAMFFSLTMTYCFLIKDLPTKQKLMHYAIALIPNFIIYRLTDARISIILLSAFMIYDITMQFLPLFKKILSKIAPTMFVVLTCGSFLLATIYTPDNPLLNKVNTGLSLRPELWQIAIEKYDIKLFGNKLKYYNQKTNTIGQARRGEVVLIDNSYLQLLLSDGLIITLIVLLYFYRITKKLQEKQDTTGLLILTTILAQSFINPDLMTIKYDIFLLIGYQVLPYATERQYKNLKSLSIERLHKVQLQMLKKFAKFCDKNKLTYYLCGGTLLGAIRHKGFIPWDDDVDILMPRPDFEKIQKILTQTTIAKDIKTQLPPEKKSIFPFIKVYNPKYNVIEKDMKDHASNHIWLDVFPIDGLSNNHEQNQKLYKKIYRQRRFLRLKQLKPINIMRNSKSIFKLISKPFLIVIANITPYSVHIKRIDKLSRKYNYENSKYVGGVMWGYGPQERMLKKDVEKKVLVDFEGEKFYTFSCYKKYLKNLYGDYMQLPPEEKRQTHLTSMVELNEKDQDE